MKQIGKLQFFLLFQTTDQDTGIFFDTDEINFRVFHGKFGDKTTFSHADFDMDGILIVKIPAP